MYGVIYKSTNLVNGKVYIGQTTSTLENRISNHKSASKSDSKSHVVFYKAIRKYEFDNFKWETIDVANSKDELNQKEIYWIDYYRSCIYFDNCNGYNMTVGGEGTSGLVGEDSGYSKLTNENVIQIKKLIIEGCSFLEIANMYKVNRITINYIALDKSWKHIKVDGWDEYLEKGKIGKCITEKDALRVKKLIVNGYSFSEIEAMININYNIISKIASDESWKHVLVDGWDEYLETRGKRAQLTESKIIEIKKMLIDGFEHKRISNITGVSVQTVTSISCGRNHSNISVDGWDKYRERHKFSEDKVIEIRKRLMNGEKQCDLAREYKITKYRMSDIARGKNYKGIHVEGFNEWLKNKKK